MQGNFPRFEDPGFPLILPFIYPPRNFHDRNMGPMGLAAVLCNMCFSPYRLGPMCFMIVLYTSYTTAGTDHEDPNHWRDSCCETGDIVFQVVLHVTLNLVPISGLIMGSLGVADPITVRKLCLAIGSLHILVPGLMIHSLHGLRQPGNDRCLPWKKEEFKGTHYQHSWRNWNPKFSWFIFNNNTLRKLIAEISNVPSASCHTKYPETAAPPSRTINHP